MKSTNDKLDEIFNGTTTYRNEKGEYCVKPLEFKAKINKLLIEARLEEAKEHWLATLREDYSLWSAKRLAQLQANLKG